jgi:hypothetical protein
MSNTEPTQPSDSDARPDDRDPVTPMPERDRKAGTSEGGTSDDDRQPDDTGATGTLGEAEEGRTP